MCGITGYFVHRSPGVPKLSHVEVATDCLAARGPDNAGNFLDPGRTALGHRRLSIIDTTTGASQPMSDPSGRYTLVFNGEIFNFAALSEKHLAAHWARNGGPLTRSDTEVLLHLLIQYGIACLPWLSGFFAFALYDRQEKTLLLGRDRFGKKPLLYYASEDAFVFASEMKALLAWDAVPRELDFDTLYHYLQFNYVPQPFSMIRGVCKLPPGHSMRVDERGASAPEAFYELRPEPKSYARFSYEDAQAELVRLMDASVQERMISDVPLGAFLSGGVDSSVVVALASRYTPKLHTFSIGYRDHPYFDETRYARLVANRFHTEHTAFSLADDDFFEALPRVLDYIDEPFADSSAIPMYILSQHTRKHVTVSLSGDGGDEVFAGYHKHGAEWRARQRSPLNALVKAGYPLWNALPRGRNGKLTNKVRQLHRFAEGARLGAADRYLRWASLATPQDVESLLSASSTSRLDRTNLDQRSTLFSRGINGQDYNEVLAADMRLVLLSDMLVKVDMMSMAASLEVRSPFLDYKVVDFAFSLPAEYKINGHMKKRIVQDAFRSMLPDEIYNRPKQGFEIPLLDWFRGPLWGEIDGRYLEKSFVAEQGLFDPAATEALKARLRSNNPGESVATVWAFIVFQHWWQRYLA